jgi:hypothetical protein
VRLVEEAQSTPPMITPPYLKVGRREGHTGVSYLLRLSSSALETPV